MTAFAAQVLLTVLTIFLYWQGVASADTASTANVNTTSPSSSTINEKLNVTSTDPSDRIHQTDNKTLLERSLYVAVGLSAIVAIYFIVRTIKTRGKRKTKRYGVIHGAADMEMQPLEKHMDEDEEDMTVFDLNEKKQPK